MRTKLRALALALAATALTAGAANAAIELQAYSFTATTPGPITNHSGSFILAYDDTAGTYALNSIDFRLDAYVFDNLNSGVRSYYDGVIYNGFMIGGTQGGGGVAGIMSSQYDFLLIFGPQRNIKEFIYATPTDRLISYGTTSPTITRTDLPTPGAVPEPTTWALMILGFGAAGAALRRRRLAIA